MGCANFEGVVRVLCKFRTSFAQDEGVVRVLCCANFAQAWSSCLPKAISSSFQLQIVYGLKRWILDFLSFEMSAWGPLTERWSFYTISACPDPSSLYSARVRDQTIIWVFHGTNATPVSSPPPKRTRISGLGESSRAPPSPPASTIPGSSHLAEVLKRPMIAGPPLPGNTDIRDRPFHDEICMEHETLRLLPELEESYRLLQRYHIEPFMTPRSFYYPRVVLDFYQTMTTRGVQDPIAIHFLIDGQHGILEARDIAAAMHFPPIPEDLGSFRHWSQYSEPDMVSTLSGGRVTGRTF
ncbi:hypothetical protein CK203_049924 [Vitis vinifera]|uniref:Uncharacterized protein n=1 Tax=Vitis vinifera TaxID=29760 RepID=A0A438GRW1_VITVI|nr:hypothetical protein CK203_049924 [Vitis vinifera]